MSESQPIKNERIVIIDFLRGFSLLGVVISNYMAFQNIGIKDVEINRFLKIIEEIFCGPQWITLSFLFGFGFWALIHKQENNFWSFLKRMFWLFLIGIFNACMFHLDILRDFAVLGIFLFMAPYFSKKNLLYLTILMTICIPLLHAYLNVKYEGYELTKELIPLFISHDFFDVIQYNLEYTYIVQIQNPLYLFATHYEMFCLFLWGVLANRCKVFEDQQTLFKWIKFALAFSIFAMACIWGFNYLNHAQFVSFSRIYSTKIVLEMLCALFAASLIAMIYTTGILKKLFSWITIYGRMTLTNYLAQNIIALLIFSGFGLGIGKNQPLWIYFLLGFVVYVLQLIISVQWSKKYQLGPVEWLWRSLSAGQILPLKKSA